MGSGGLVAWTDEASAEVDALVTRYEKASGVLMKLANYVGAKAESMINALPTGVKELIADGTSAGLQHAYDAAVRVGGLSVVPETGAWANRVGVVLSGAAGGFGGMATSIVEIPVTIATMFGSIQRIAVANGFDPTKPETRMECLTVFGSGGPLREDDAAELSFLAHRMAVNGATVSVLIQSIAPKLAGLITQKLAAQAVPVLGAVSGATVNYAFIEYFEEMAEVRFRLRKLATIYGDDRVADEFRLSVQKARQVQKPKRLL